MRIIDYYNYIAMAAYILMGVAAIYFFIRGKRKGILQISDTAANIIFILIMLLTAFLRLYRLGDVPYGLQQDEASIGYDAFTLATYGIDRNGYHFPIYPITWGCGGGSPLLIYLNVISIKVFGPGIVKLRMIPAVCGILTVLLFYLTLRISFRGRDEKNFAALLGAGFLAVCPWHIIISRWSLDCNIMPFTMMLAVYLFLLGVQKRSTLFYGLSAAAFSICMYSYGAATIVVPLFLLLISAYCLRAKVITWGQLGISVLAFMVVFAPLLLFYAVNYLGLPEIVTDYVCFNRFTAARTGEAFLALDKNLPSKLFSNLRSMLLTVSVGNDRNTIAHFFKGYGTVFEFTFPVTAVGLVISCRELFAGKREGKNGSIFSVANAIFLFLTLGSVILDLVILPDINRLVMIFVPVIYFFVRGSVFICEHLGQAVAVILSVILLVGGMSFSRDYFRDFNTWSISIYMPGYGEAIKRAYEVAGDERTIYSTYDGLSAPFMLALYYNNYDPYRFYTTVEYKDDKAEFRIAKSFGNFVFELPENLMAPERGGDVYVISSAERAKFGDTEGCVVEDFGGYFVVYR